MQTLTYVYAEQTAVLGPLATFAEPHAYDLCQLHGERLSAPRGWEVVRLPGEYRDPGPSSDDLLALADAVREAGRVRPADRRDPHAATPVPASAETGRETTRRGHLRVLTD